MSINPVVMLVKIYLWCWDKAKKTPEWFINWIVMPLILLWVIMGIIGFFI